MSSRWGPWCLNSPRTSGLVVFDSGFRVLERQAFDLGLQLSVFQLRVLGGVLRVSNNAKTNHDSSQGVAAESHAQLLL